LGNASFIEAGNMIRPTRSDPNTIRPYVDNSLPGLCFSHPAPPSPSPRTRGEGRDEGAYPLDADLRVSKPGNAPCPRTNFAPHPEVLGAKRRASKGEAPGAEAASFEAPRGACHRAGHFVPDPLARAPQDEADKRTHSRDAHAPEFCENVGWVSCEVA